MHKGKLERHKYKLREDLIKNLPDFTPTLFSDVGIGVDVDRRKLIIAPIGEEFAFFDFNSVLDVEALKDGNSIGSSAGNLAGGAAVGALLLGPIGALLGAASMGNNSQHEFRKLSLKIYTDNIVSPIHEVVFFESSSPKSISNAKVKEAADELDNWFGRLRAIIHSNGPHSD